MPIYEYACTSCGERTEAKQRFSDPPLEVCPVCGGRLRKLYSPVGIVFKGTGFYSTDARKDRAASASGSKDGKATERQGAKQDTKERAAASATESAGKNASKKEEKSA